VVEAAKEVAQPHHQQPLKEMADLLKLGLPGRRDHHTTAGFALAQLGRFPRLGKAFEASGWGLEVVDIDGRLAQPMLGR
jgi:putative hemolysin